MQRRLSNVEFYSYLTKRGGELQTERQILVKLLDFSFMDKLELLRNTEVKLHKIVWAKYI